MKRLFIFDMDGTILPNTTGLIETARYFETEKELLQLEEDFSRNLLDTTQFTQTISKLWGTIPKKVAEEIFASAPKLEDLEACLRDIRKNGDYSCIITLSQDFFAEHFKEYGVDYVYSTPYPPNHGNVENLKCLTAEDKGTLVLELCEKLDIHPDDCVAFGDSLGDLPLFIAVGYAMAINPSKELSKYVALTYRGNSILEAYKAIKKYIHYIENPKIKGLVPSCEDLNCGRTIIAKAFADCIKELYNHPSKEVEFKSLWLKKIQLTPHLTATGWYSPPESGMAILFSQDKATQRSHFTTYRDPEYFSSEVEIDWQSGIITGYASNLDTRNHMPGDFGTTVYLGNDTKTIRYIEQCIFVSEAVFCLLETGAVRTSAELFNAANKLFKKYGLEGNSYSSTAGFWNLGHTLYSMETETIETYSKYRRFISNEDIWDLRDGTMFTYEPQYHSLNDPTLPKLMHHYVLQYMDGEFQICKKCVDNCIIQKGIVRKEIS